MAADDEPSPGVVRLLGWVSDAELARRLGIDAKTVRRWRTDSGIPVADPRRVPRYSWTPDRVALLGTMRDTDLARLLGLKPASVQGARERRDIPAYVAPRDGPSREAIRLARLTAGHTQEHAAGLLGWGKSRWAGIEAGTMHMPEEAWERYLAALTEPQRREVREQLRVQLLDKLLD